MKKCSIPVAVGDFLYMYSASTNTMYCLQYVRSTLLSQYYARKTGVDVATYRAQCGVRLDEEMSAQVVYIELRLFVPEYRSYIEQKMREILKFTGHLPEEVFPLSDEMIFGKKYLQYSKLLKERTPVYIPSVDLPRDHVLKRQAHEWTDITSNLCFSFTFSRTLDTTILNCDVVVPAGEHCYRMSKM